MTATFTLYRFFAADNALLYVGRTVNPGRRMEKHRTDRPWWSEVARIAMEQHSSIDALRVAEREAIRNEKPLHNVRMNGATSQPRAVIAPAPPEPLDGLVGRWFHSYVPPPAGKDTTHCTLDSAGNIREWQGQIIAREGEMFVAQLYSWWDGCAANQVLVDAESIRLWRFYATTDAMQTADGCIEDFGPGRSGRSGRCRNPCTHVIRDWHGMGSIYRCWKCIKFYAGKAEEL